MGSSPKPPKTPDPIAPPAPPASEIPHVMAADPDALANVTARSAAAERQVQRKKMRIPLSSAFDNSSGLSIPVL